MLKKIFSAVLALSIMLVGSVAMADYPKYLNGDRNYIFIHELPRINDARYAIRNSLNVERYDPPIYVISIGFIGVRNADSDNPTFL